MKIIHLAFVQKNAGYIKGKIIKYIAPKLFYGEIKPCKPKHEICKAQGGFSLNHNQFNQPQSSDYIIVLFS